MSSQPTRSQLVLARLHALPRLTVPALVLALTVAGLMAPSAIGVVCLAILVAFLGWLGWLAWPSLDRNGRFFRGLTIGLLLGAAVARATGAL